MRDTADDASQVVVQLPSAKPPAWDWSFLEDGALALDSHELWDEPAHGSAPNLSQSRVAVSRLNRLETFVTVPRTMPPRRASARARMPRRRRAAGSVTRFAALVLVACVAIVTLVLTAFGTGGVDRVADQVPAPRDRLLPLRPQPETIALHGSLRVQLPIARTRVTAIGYHPSGGGALALEPLGHQGNRGLLGRLVDRVFGSGETRLTWYQLPGGSGPATAALNVGAAPATDVFSPVDGTVIGITGFELNNEQYGSRIDIQPAGAPSLVVSITRVDPDPALTVGSAVVSAGTRIGTVLDLSRVESQALARYTQDAGNHVTVEVFPAPALALN